MILSGVVARYFDAWNDHDPVACGDCFAPHGVREWRVLAPPHIGGDPFPRFVGPREIGGRIAAFMASVPDLELDMSALSAGSDERIWTEWRLRGTHVIDLGPWQARGEPLDYLGVSIFRVGDRGIEEEVVYWDTMLMFGSRKEAASAYLS
jgi:SnoaL-like domain